MNRNWQLIFIFSAVLPAVILSGCIGQPPGRNGNATGGNMTVGETANESVDPCANVTCPDTTQTCPDGFVASCRNKCVDGVCTTCLPDCSGRTKPVCEESWSCTDWTPCESNFQSRECTDANTCGTQKSRPTEMRPCAPDLPTHLIISEVYYDAYGDDSLHEWIELYNPMFENVSLDGYSLLDNSKESMRWFFPNGSVLQPGTQFVIARDSEAVRLLFGCTPDASGFTFQLNNNADHLGLYDGQGKLIDFVAWGGESGWNLTTKTDTSIKRNPINIDTDSEEDWATDQEAHPGNCFFSE